MLEHTPEIQRGIHDWISEREERRKNTSGVVAGASNGGSAFLGDRILGKHSRTGRSSCAEIYSGARREGSSTKQIV